MITAEEYVQAVLRHVPHTSPERASIAGDLRGHFAECVEAGESEAGAVRRMGPPAEVAARFLADVPRDYAPVSYRLGAYIVDIGLVLAPLFFGLAWLARRQPGLFAQSGDGLNGDNLLALLAMIAPAVLLWLLYFPVLEAWFDQTLGKRLFGIAVVKTSGARVGFGAAVIRRLPHHFEFAWLDALFALFTTKRQRAFDLVANTMVVRGPRWVSPGRAWLVAGAFVVASVAAALVLHREVEAATVARNVIADVS